MWPSADCFGVGAWIVFDPVTLNGQELPCKHNGAVSAHYWKPSCFFQLLSGLLNNERNPYIINKEIAFKFCSERTLRDPSNSYFFFKWKLLKSDVRRNFNVAKYWAVFRNAGKLAGIVIMEQTGKQDGDTHEQLPWNESSRSTGIRQQAKKILWAFP